MAAGAIAVVDYGMGNLRSVAKALEHVANGKPVVVTADPAVVAAAERVVVPGQGAMPDCMRELNERGLRQAVIDAAASKPFLGICIGQQMLFEHSEEGNVPGLGILRGQVKRFPADKMHLPDGHRQADRRDGLERRRRLAAGRLCGAAHHDRQDRRLPPVGQA